MKNRFDSARRFVAAVGVGIGVLVAQRVNEWLAAHKVSDGMLIVVAFAIIMLASELLIFQFDHWLLNWPPIRRLMLGRYYVEGTWLDVMTKDNRVLALGITRIQPDDESIKISGEDCDPSGRFSGRYTTELYSLGWPCVGYLYHYTRSDDSAHEARGFVELQFDPRNGPPVRYRGDYVDPGDGTRITFEGWKVRDREVLRQLDDPAQRTRAIRGFYEGISAP